MTQHLKTVDTERLKCVVLLDRDISALQLCSELRRLYTVYMVRCYDAGIKMFYDDGIPIYREGGAGEGGEAELIAWLRAEGGVLVTDAEQFRGAEADYVIFITRSWGVGYTSNRNPVTRAVAGLLMIASNYGVGWGQPDDGIGGEMGSYWEANWHEEDSWTNGTNIQIERKKNKQALRKFSEAAQVK